LSFASNAYILPNITVFASGSLEPVKVISLTTENDQAKFTTTKNTLKEALESQGISFEKNDLVDPGLDTNLNEGTTEVFIYKARPVTIIDGDKIIIGRSAYLSVFEILKDLSINLYANDEVSIADPLDDVVPGLKIYINRANTINIQVDGKLREIHTRLKKVSDLIYSENIALGEFDRVEPALNTPLTEGLEINIIRISKDESSETYEIPFAIQYKDDANFLEGESKIERRGEVGKKKITFKKVIENGTEKSKEILSTEIIKEPVSQIVIKGRKPRFTYADGAFGEWINDAALKYGVDAGKMQRMMTCESGGNPNSVGGGGRFYGLFQYLPSTWAGASAGAGYAGASIYDAKAQIYTTAWKISIQGYGAWPVCGRK